MKAFLAKRPGTGALTMIVAFIIGAALARESDSKTPPLQALSLSAAPAKPRKAEAPDWTRQLDPGRARLRRGRLVQSLRDGRRVTYTLDPDLQQWAAAYLDRYELPYAGMAMYELDTGKLLVLAGHSERKPEMGARELCLRPWAPAASVFKLITTSALLEDGVPPQTRVCYHGGLRGLQKHHIEDHPKWDTTCRTLSYAVAKSVNPIMAKLAVRYLGQDELASWADRFGFNRALPLTLPVEPSKAAIPAERLELARVAAGFWHTEISVLHGAVIAGVAASGGELRWPHAVQAIRRPDGTIQRPEPPASERAMSRASARRLARMMVRTTTIGTARRGFRSRRGRYFLGDVKVGGKTGSLSRSKPFLHYNWFVGFAPADKPEVAFAVLLGNPAKWRIKAHTAARMLLQQYFDAKRARQAPPTAVASR